MATHQLISEVVWSKTGADGSFIPSKKLVIEAEDYGFNLIAYQGGNEASNKNNFEEQHRIELSQTILRNFTKGLLNGFLTKLRANAFRKSDSEMKDEIFFDGRQVVKNGEVIYVIRLIGGYKIINNKRIRQTVMKLYSLSSWSEITEIRDTKKYPESRCIFSINFNTSSTVEECYSPEDRIIFDSMYDKLSSVLIGINAQYSDFLNEVKKQSSQKTNTSEGGTVTETTNEADDFDF